MKTLNFDIFEEYLLTNKEMICVRGGDGEGDGVDPVVTPPTNPIKV